MAIIDLHDKPFDEATLAKLDIFEKYTQAWLPTFVMQSTPTICIFDLFAGTGYDLNGEPGSPIRILNVIKQYIGHIFTKRVNVRLYLNEFKQGKKRLLEQAVQQYLIENSDVARAISYKIFQQDFNQVYTELLPEIEKYPSLVFLDQNGIKFTNLKNLLALERTRQTDFLFFISSSHVRRFGSTKEFSNHLSIDMEALKSNPYRFIHEDVVKAISNQIPTGSALKLHPFSIKKGTNIHGLVFGAKHPRAVEKFLQIVWKHSPLNGQANFDINDDVVKPALQLDMFATEPKKNKIDKFKEQLESMLREFKTVTNRQIYLFTLEHGHPLSHATEHLKFLKNNAKKIHFEGVAPKINFKDAYKGECPVVIKWNGF
ncbi:three-Cys-motif partner protein TcmP [Pontibacter indicus]|uniref:Three-Cys-motif partner protein n=1 Tax=Pontibacter indicus TaxID=1317125 RepID=A0A1R3XRG6_9BACT|nr:three-Cys-motif partner protein TcmP [Pontibacter indicus]SIT94043.1 three-Cys-motif partner protein [Pontibacter indicus]